ncbi:MAG: AAA family ATPase [Thermoguttaceae bacterium]
MLTNNLRNYIAACFSGLWIETFEPDEAIREIETLCNAESWNHSVWDVSVSDPLTAVKSAETLGDGETPQLIVLRNFHRFLGSIEVVQAVERQIQRGKVSRTFLIVLAPGVQIPVELEKLFVVVEHPLPDKEQLRQIATDIAGELPDDVNTTRVLEAAAGLTRMEAEGAFSLSLIEHDALLPEPIWTLKANLLRQSSALRLYRGEIPTLGGLDNLAQFCTRALSGNDSGERAKGVMLLGTSGCGKSAYAKRLGHSVHRPTLILDIGALMGSLVGQTEAALRKALQQIDAMSPCVVMIDEVEKAVANGGNDGGVSTRLLGTLLTWLNDRTSDSFIVCTANDITKLPPEFTRSERFDGIFFVDLPDKTAREQIWRIYERQYGFENPRRPDDNDWTGAEIKSCCRLAKLLDVSLQEAARNVVPVSVTAAESIETLRRWASGRCLDSASPGTYLHRPRAGQRRNLGTARSDGPISPLV